MCVWRSLLSPVALRAFSTKGLKVHKLYQKQVLEMATKKFTVICLFAQL